MQFIRIIAMAFCFPQILYRCTVQVFHFARHRVIPHLGEFDNPINKSRKGKDVGPPMRFMAQREVDMEKTLKAHFSAIKKNLIDGVLAVFELVFDGILVLDSIQERCFYGSDSNKSKLGDSCGLDHHWIWVSSPVPNGDMSCKKSKRGEQ
jgi:hypothetical protein